MPSLRTDFIKISDDSAIGQGIFRLAQDFSLERVVFIENYPSESHAVEWARDCTPEVDKEFDRALTLSLRKLSRERHSQYLRPEELGLDSSISNIKSIGLIDVGQKSILCLFDSREEPDWWGSPSLVSGYISAKEKKIAYLENPQKALLQSASDGSVEFLKKSSDILASSKDKIGIAFDVLEIGMKELGMDVGVYAKFNEDSSKFSLTAHSGLKPVLLAELENGFGTAIETGSEALANSVRRICSLESAFSVPVLLNDKFSGALCFGSTKAQVLNEGQNAIFKHLSSILAFSENFSKRIEFGRQHSRACLLYTSPSPRDKRQSRMPSSA